MKHSIFFSRPEARAESIDDLLKIVRTGKIIIPFFQRNFVWDKKDISNLFDSIYRGYPVGNLLFWKRKMEIPDNKIKIGPLEFTQEESGEVDAVVDGQQRLTSLAGVLLLKHATVSKEEENDWNLYFDLKKESFVFPKKTETPPSHWLPMSIVADTLEYLKWLRSLMNENPELIETADNVAKAIRDYKIPVYRVESDETEVREIFERLNYMGKPLQPSDIFNAIVSEPKQNTSVRIHDIQEILKREGYGIPNDYTLLKAIYAILDIPLYDKVRVRKILRESSTKRELEQLSGEIPNIYNRLIHFLQNVAKIENLLLLPYYNVTFIPLMKIFHRIPKPSSLLQEHLSSWIWRASLSGAHRNPSPSDMTRILDNISENEEKLMTVLLKEDFDIKIDNFEVERFDFRHAKVKILCCSLLAQRPKNLITEDDLDFRTIFREHGTKAFSYIYPRSSKEYLSMPGNRLLNLGKSSSRSLLETACQNAVSEETLLSHLIDNEALDYFQNEQSEEFIKHRTTLMNERAREFIQQKCQIPD
jgi:hypothetical protein